MSKQNSEDLNSKLRELDEVLAWFDSDEIDLEAALDKFETGSKLAEDIKRRLDEVQNKITDIEKRFDSVE